MTTILGTSTNQESTGAATLLSAAGLNNFLVWTGTSPNTNWINFATAPVGTYTFPEAPNKSYSSSHGPAFVLLPTNSQGYVFWTDSATSQIMFAQASGTADGVWSLASTATTITGSKASGGPAAALGMQNGQVVINIIWQDSGLGSMALSQFNVFGTQTEYPFTSLGQSCVDAPALQVVGNMTFLAWFDTSNNCNCPGTPTH